MIVELGHFALLLAACVALVQTVVPLVCANSRRARHWTLFSVICAGWGWHQ